MPSLFRRKTAEPAAEPVTTEPAADAAHRPKGYTPSKKELGQATPKRVSTGRRVGPEAAAPANRREQVKQMRERQRQERAEAAEGMRAGDERYLLARDRGPERLLVRNIVDSRRTVGTWFFGGALIVLVGSAIRIPAVQLGSNILWLILAVGVVHRDRRFVGRVPEHLPVAVGDDDLRPHPRPLPPQQVELRREDPKWAAPDVDLVAGVGQLPLGEDQQVRARAERADPAALRGLPGRRGCGG